MLRVDRLLAVLHKNRPITHGTRQYVFMPFRLGGNDTSQFLLYHCPFALSSVTLLFAALPIVISPICALSTGITVRLLCHSLNSTDKGLDPSPQ